MSPELHKTWETACLSRQRSYSPYSHFAVGAALKIRNSELTVGGCNVENASYGGTVCAERSAVFSAVSQGHIDFEFLVVVTDAEPAAVPCAFCLGVLAEFCPPDFPIHLANLGGIERSYRLDELLPHPFKLL